jgi:hypothetical protein
MALVHALKNTRFMAAPPTGTRPTARSPGAFQTRASSRLLGRAQPASIWFFSAAPAWRSARQSTWCLYRCSRPRGDAFGRSSLLDRHGTLFQVCARQATSALCSEASELSACRDTAEFELGLFGPLELVAGRVNATEARLAEFCGGRSPELRAGRFACLLVTPAASAVVIAAVVVVGASGDPDGVRTWRTCPVSRRPDVAPAPVPEAPDPDITRPGSITDNTDHRRRRRRSRHIISRLRRTTRQRKQGQRRYQPK